MCFVQAKYHDALRVAIRLNVMDTILSTFAACTGKLQARGLGVYICHAVSMTVLNSSGFCEVVVA